MSDEAAKALLRAILQDKQAAHWHEDIRVVLADVSRGTSLVPIDACVNPNAWNEWLAYRRERKLPAYRQSAATKLQLWLGSKSAAEQQAIIDQSIRNNWQGLFEHKGSINGQGAGSRYDRLGREFEGKAAGVLSMESAAPNVRDTLAGPVRDGAERSVDTRRR